MSSSQVKGKPERILITGASGFFGIHLTRQALDHGYETFTLTRRTSNTDKLLWLCPELEAAQLLKGDLGNHDEISTILEELKPDIVIHAACYGVDYNQQDIQQAIAINITGTCHLHQSASKTGSRLFINIGTSYEYGNQSGPILEATPLAPRGLYACSKASQHYMLAALSQQNQLLTLFVKPFTMFGPLEGSHKLLQLVMSASGNSTTIPLTPGEQLRNYIYAPDAARSVIRVLGDRNLAQGETIHLFDRNLTLKQFLQVVEETLQLNADLFNWGAKPYRSDEIMSNHPPDTPCQWVSPTPLEAALSETASINLEFNQRKV
jgi:nucleoside-diphosphate-sugar epimerase